jgi:arginine repressor
MRDVQVFQRHWLIKAYLKDQSRFLKRSRTTEEIQAYLESYNLDVDKKLVQRDLKILEAAHPRIRRRTPKGDLWFYELP